MSTTHRKPARWNPLAALAAWVLPGLGHVVIGERRRGYILMASIMALWLAGTLIGGISVFDRVEHKFWYLGQMLVAPSVVMEITHNHALRPRPGVTPAPGDQPVYEPSFGRVNEQGVLYTALAGLLNLLAIIDVAYREPARTARRGEAVADPPEPAAPGGSS